ncbi:putative oxidoreductase OrdL [Lentibacillus populi]|uniref:Oxidoreductase OrdL n=1 Tax=Lentibacillus populi TaxID=1827502 RepID=A0A9W5TX39_9BACI|nr:FAD-binding oxidoreductase [Lentibacillus populi]GGB40743.1 putative oxidoreductase OrdL [Lentibacillus populi]
MEQQSLWEATANERKERQALQGEQHCDVVVIGGGFSGLSTAYHLQRKNCQTIILEKESVGFGASGRNGGEVLTGYIGSMELHAKKKGLEAARQMWQLSLDSIDLIEHIINTHQISCAFRRNGDFHAAYKPSHLDGMKREQEVMERDFDYKKIKVVEKQDLHSELNTPFYHGGRVDESSAHFHPLNYALGLAEAVEEMGGTIYEQSEALSYRKESGKVVVNTNKGRVIAKELVIVTNAYSGDFQKTIKKTIVPVESIMIATEPLSEELCQDLIKHDRAVSDTKNLLYYFRLTADHRLAFGGSGRSSSKRDQENLFNNLRAGMITVFPQLKNAQVDYRWGGKVGFTQEMLPYMGQLEDGSYYAFGFAGHGAAMSSMAGKLIAKNILHEGGGDNPLEKARLRPIPFHSQHAKAVGMMKFYMKFRDRIS